MTCKYADMRRGYAINIPRKLDAEIIRRSECPLPGEYPYYMQIWRQYHVAEARKRGLLK